MSGLVLALAASVLIASSDTAPYAPGTAYIYSGGRVEMVVEDRGDSVVWRTRRGREYTRARNVVLPILDWTIGTRTGTRRFYGNTDRIWPPRSGARTRFRVVTDVERRGEVSRSIQFWTCRVGEAETIELSNGPFETLPVQCERFSANTMSLLERRTWWWSEDIGHYVRRVFLDMRDGDRSEYRLCAVLPPRLATETRIDAVAEAGC